MKSNFSLLILGFILALWIFKIDAAFASTYYAIPATVNTHGCDVGGSDCTIIIEVPDPPPPTMQPPPPDPDHMAVAWNPASQTQIGTDLYQALASEDTTAPLPSGWSNVQFVVYSLTSRDITSDFESEYPDIPYVTLVKYSDGCVEGWNE